MPPSLSRPLTPRSLPRAPSCAPRLPNHFLPLKSQIFLLFVPPLIHRKSIFRSYISLFYIFKLIRLYIDFLLWVLCPERGLRIRRSGDQWLTEVALSPRALILKRESPILLKQLKSHLIEFFSFKMYKLRDFCFPIQLRLRGV